MELNKIYCGDALEVLKTFPSECVDSCITSPPYWKIRDFGVEGQIGWEKTVDEYIEVLVRVFEEVKRVLKKEGSLWIDIGDAPENGSLRLLPERLVLALRNAGFFVRNKIIWHKPNSRPESVRNRFTIDYNVILFLTKIPSKYYFKQLFEPYRDKNPRDRFGSVNPPGEKTKFYTEKYGELGSKFRLKPEGRNRRCVWSLTIEPSTYVHFAPFPKKLVRLLIEASCPENGVVLDPFIGIGTTALVAQEMGRNYVGIDLNPEYCKITEERLEKEKKTQQNRKGS